MILSKVDHWFIGTTKSTIMYMVVPILYVVVTHIYYTSIQPKASTSNNRRENISFSVCIKQAWYVYLCCIMVVKSLLWRTKGYILNRILNLFYSKCFVCWRYQECDDRFLPSVLYQTQVFYWMNWFWFLEEEYPLS